MTYPALPTTVTIDGLTYRIVLDADIKPGGDRKAQDYQEDGEFDASQQEIRLRPGMAPGYARHILTHELLHALWEHAGLTAAGGPLETFEEQVVTALAHRLHTFLRDNPAFVAFVTET